MAKYEAILHGDLAMIVNEVENAVGQSISASVEESCFHHFEGGKCVVKAYERYSMLGKNRVGMTVTYVQHGDEIFVSAITLGGSQARLFKINTLGEEAFLNTVRKILDAHKN